MSGKPFLFIICLIGATALWILSGFHGDFQSHMPRPLEDSKKFTKAFTLGILVFCLTLFVLFEVVEFYSTRPTREALNLTPEQMMKKL